MGHMYISIDVAHLYNSTAHKYLNARLPNTRQIHERARQVLASAQVSTHKCAVRYLQLLGQSLRTRDIIIIGALQSYQVVSKVEQCNERTKIKADPLYCSYIQS